MSKRLKEILLILILVAATWKMCNAQKLRDCIPSALCVLGAGATDGLRDASMFRMDGYSQWMNGKQSWTNKWKNNDPKQGEAYFGSSTFLVWTTDLPHFSNLFTHQLTGMGMAFMPPDNNKKFGHVFLKVLVFNAIRSIGHYVVYDVAFKTQYRD